MELFRVNKNQEWFVYFRAPGKKANFDGVCSFFLFFFNRHIEKINDLITSFFIGPEFNYLS